MHIEANDSLLLFLSTPGHQSRAPALR